MIEEQPTAATSACPHPEAVGTRWGDPISDERQAELRALADQQREWAARPEAERGDSAFKHVELTGADAFWLAERACHDHIFRTVPDLHRRGPSLAKDIWSWRSSGQHTWRGSLS
ncbi:MAG TPA: hypothetical protein VGN32_04775 [Ktedonobacterales bacterium]|nr:hypothetical protein [Ktedonobacterales bacterium]